MVQPKKFTDIGLLQDFFRKNHKPSLTCDQTKVEITTSEITPLLFKGKSNFSKGKVNLSGPVMHTRYQPLWFAILLDLNARQATEQVFQFCFSLVDLMEKAERVCQAMGMRQINYTIGEVSYFLLILIEFRFEIQTNTICQASSVFSEISREVDLGAISRASVTINPRMVNNLWVVTNAVSFFLTTLFFSKREVVYDLLQKLLLKKDAISLSDIAPATLQHVQLLSYHGFVTYTKKSKFIYIHSVNVLIEGLSPL